MNILLLYHFNLDFSFSLFVQADEINEAGCRLVTEVARKHYKLIGLPLSTTRSYANKEGKGKVQKEFRQQIAAFEKWEGDLIMAEVKFKNFICFKAAIL